MNGPNEILDEEHRVLRELLDVLEAFAVRLARGAPVPGADLEDALKVVVNFGERSHHAKEERIYFPLLREARPSDGDLVDRLETEHGAAGELVEAMRESAAGEARGDARSMERFAKAARAYVALVREHIDVETRDLFPFAEDAMPHAALEEVAERFERFERDEGGVGSRERYASIVHALAGKYVQGAAA